MVRGRLADERAENAGDAARLRRYAEALAFAEGDQWLAPARRGEARLTFNYARAVVRKTAAYVFPAPVTFRAGPARPGEEAGAAATERALSAAVAALDLGALDVALCREAATLGDAAVKVTWDAEGDVPVVAPVDPASLSARTAPDRPRRVLEVSQRYGLPPDRLEELGWLRDGHLALPDRLLPVTEHWTIDRWRVEAAGQVVRDGENPYGWIPYVLLPNDPRPHDLWGRSDLEDLYDACREINSRISTLSRILELSGAPIAEQENVDCSDGIADRPGA
ncbi:MAG: phage portal protein, partial [Thermomicrobiales bacterium]